MVWSGRPGGALESLAAEGMQLSLVRQARGLFALAEGILRPRSGLTEGTNAATALLLLREALLFALLALEPPASTPRSLHDLLSSLRTRDPFRANAEVWEPALAGLERTLVAPEPTALAERSDLRAEAEARRAEQLLGRLLAALPDPDAALARKRRRRLLYSLLASLLLLAVISGAPRFGASLLYGKDLTRHATFRTSSSYGGFSAADRTANNQPTEIFFHTAEDDSPWLEYDLGKARAVHRIEVRNRSDCCPERAVPLVLEVALDREHFREIARKTESFAEWNLTFTRVQARYVRLRVARRSILHFERVAIR
jgi:hypothetical protein